MEIYIDKAKPLHLKNNVCKEMFMKIWDVMIVAQVNTTVKQYKYIPQDNLLDVFVQFVCKETTSTMRILQFTPSTAEASYINKTFQASFSNSPAFNVCR